MASASKKNLNHPDERVAIGGIAADVVQLGDTAVSRNVFQPGAHCALGGQRIAGNHRADRSCMAHHTGVLLDGQLHVEMDDGSTLDIGPNDVFDIPPGHDGWVIGDAPMRGINWSGVRTWLPEPGSGERVLASLLFTDIVGSTELAARVGDDRWRELLGHHNRVVRAQLDRFRGREVVTTGDGFLAVFDGAARTIRAAIAIRAAVGPLGLEVRQGIHTGEVELVGGDVRGIAVHEAARIATEAGPGEIVVSASTRMLADGLDVAFDDRGIHVLKGLTGERQLYAVIDGSEGPVVRP
ncbi:MAG TPA: adenylate/guanylate cyclase domain-containing protein [Candidatus Limnocylindrales bacterium]|nr:adenylate/guanylate cyclase domain-containing protein [Candidatus Limnocylindrales bacterium]